MRGEIGLSAPGGLSGDSSEVSATAAKIGPNAISRMAEAVTQLHGSAACKALFAECGMLHYLMQSPQGMVDEQHVIRLHGVARRRLDMADYRRVARLAGDLTGHYVRRHRIPRAAQWLIRGLPRSLAMLVLTRAISRHAWTFVGSGSLRYQRRSNEMLILIEDSPLARGRRCDSPICDYYTASFECLFRELVCKTLTVTELECVASGMKRCVFRVGPDKVGPAKVPSETSRIDVKSDR